MLEQVQEQQQSSFSQVPRVKPTTSWLNELQREAFDILLGTVNARCGASIDHLWGFSQNILAAGQAYFEDELVGEATWDSHHPCHVHFASGQKGGLTSTPPQSLVKVGEDNILLPQQRKTRETLMNLAMCPPRYEMQMAMQEFCKMCEPKINKMKGGYSATANLIFQSWLKDIRVHIENQNLTEREAMQLIVDFTAEHAHEKVEFYMGMVVEDQQTFEGLVQHLKNVFQSGETISELISDFYGWAQKRNESEDVLADNLHVLVQKLNARKPEFRANANEQLKNQYAHKLQDPYYAAIAHSMLQSSDSTESFTQF